jgi:hypothetical protein
LYNSDAVYNIPIFKTNVNNLRTHKGNLDYVVNIFGHLYPNGSPKIRVAFSFVNNTSYENSSLDESLHGA